MKKQISITILTAAVVLCAAGIAYAGVVGTEHDLTSGGPSTNVCSYCHVPHNAAGIRIWSTYGNEAQVTAGPSSVIGNLCYTCHDGTVTGIGQSTAFNTSLQQHKVSTGKDCNMCHTVHDNTNGKFLGIQKTGGTGASEQATYCETCHAGATIHQDAVALGDHLAGSEHPYKDTGTQLNESCNSCHIAHGAADYVPASGPLAKPILKFANDDSAFCATCHGGHAQNTTDGNKHPANLTTAGTWGKVSCETCHDIHQPDTSGRVAVLKGDNTDSAYCATCHQASGAVNGPNIGEHSHPVNVAFSVTPTDPTIAPAADEIDDDVLNGLDYPGNTHSMVCESCHSMHRKGVDNPLLRKTSDAGELCKNCHTDK